MNNAAKDIEYLVKGFRIFLEFNVLIPERVSKEIKPYTACTSFKKPRVRNLCQQMNNLSLTRLSTEGTGRGGREAGDSKDGKHDESEIELMDPNNSTIFFFFFFKGCHQFV